MCLAEIYSIQGDAIHVWSSNRKSGCEAHRNAVDPSLADAFAYVSVTVGSK